MEWLFLFAILGFIIGKLWEPKSGESRLAKWAGKLNIGQQFLIIFVVMGVFLIFGESLKNLAFYWAISRRF